MNPISFWKSVLMKYQTTCEQLKSLSPSCGDSQPSLSVFPVSMVCNVLIDHENYADIRGHVPQVDTHTLVQPPDALIPMEK